MDKETVSKFQRAVGEAIKDAAKAYGFKIGNNRASYDPGIGSLKITLNFTEGDAHAKEFKLYAEMFGIKPEALGAVFTCAGKPYTIVGLLSRSRKKPVLAKDASGREFVFPVATIRRLNPGICLADPFSTRHDGGAPEVS